MLEEQKATRGNDAPYSRKKKKIRLGSLTVAMCDSINQNVYVKNLFVFSLQAGTVEALGICIFQGMVLEEVG